MTQIETDVRQIKLKHSEYSATRIEFEKKQREVDLIAEMAFQEYSRPGEKEYLLERSKLADAEAASRDIEAYCAAIENAISTLHRQKMDEVNKIIADIWQEIYHEDDINKIEILTQIEEDSKKKKNYNYSIMMEKKGSNTTKV